MPVAKNIIHRVVLDITFAGQDTAASHTALLDTARDYFYSVILPALETYLLEKYGDDNFFVPKLELDLGRITADNMHDILLAALEEYLVTYEYRMTEEQTERGPQMSIREAAGIGTPAEAPGRIREFTHELIDVANTSSLHYGGHGAGRAHIDKSGNLLYDYGAETLHPGEHGEYSAQKALLYFLCNGVYPWYFSHRVPDPDDVLTELFNAGQYQFSDEIIMVISASDTALRRFISQFEEGHVQLVFDRLVAAMTPPHRDLVRNWVDYFYKGFGHAKEADLIMLFRGILRSRLLTDTPTFVHSFFSLAAAGTGIDAPKLASFISKADTKVRGHLVTAWLIYIRTHSETAVQSGIQLLHLILLGNSGLDPDTTQVIAVSIIPTLSLSPLTHLFSHLANSFPSCAALLTAWTEFIMSHQDRPAINNGLVHIMLYIVQHRQSQIRTRLLVKTFVNEVIQPTVPLSAIKTAKLTSALTHLVDPGGSTSLQNFTDAFKNHLSNSAFLFFEDPKQTLSRVSDANNAQLLSPALLAQQAIPKPTVSSAPVDTFAPESPYYAELDSFMIHNAGMVLLNPYFNRFFEAMSFVKDGQFRSKRKQLKAAQSLHYLACGSLKTPEQEMTLNKLLTGLPADEPLPARLRLTKKQKEECETLLQSVLAHWPGLSSTSVAGLQGSFLLREGILKKDDANWLLHVEHKAYDLLLERLPWAFRLIKLPWNDYMIHVQWQ